MNKTLKRKHLPQKIEQAMALLKACTLCPRQCRVDRTAGEQGFCTTGNQAVVHGFMPHFGEEAPLSGTHGSGTIFFSHCNLKCCFCQNKEISLQGDGTRATPDQIGQAMLRLQAMGCHNINFVTPTHVVPFILKAIAFALAHGLTIPLVYNTSGYECLETLALLDGIVDIYMPDFKFWNPQVAREICQAEDYPEVARKAVNAMFRQVGDLTVDDAGIARRGLLVRHLVMPEDLAGTRDIMTFLAKEVSPATRVNIMSQYRPVGQARRITPLCRRITSREYRRARQAAADLGLTMID